MHIYTKDFKQLLALIRTTNIEILNKNIRYFEKFLPVETEIKQECCYKHQIRVSGRYCNNCPIHKLRKDTAENAMIINTAKFLLEKNDYIEFTKYLKSKKLPYPNYNEIKELL
jgi:hypothetical protein